MGRLLYTSVKFLRQFVYLGKIFNHWYGKHKIYLFPNSANTNFLKINIRLRIVKRSKTSTFLYCVEKITKFIPISLVGRADVNSIPTTFVGMVIPTKLLGTVCFDKSCNMHTNQNVWPSRKVHFLKYEETFKYDDFICNTFQYSI